MRNRAQWWVAWAGAVLAVQACSTPSKSASSTAAGLVGGGSDVAPAAGDAGTEAGSASDSAAAAADGEGGSVDAGGLADGGATDAGGVADAVADVANLDGGANANGASDGAAVDAADAGFVDPPDTGFFDPPDAGPLDSAPATPPGLGTLYAHTSSTLYKLDSTGFVLVGKFQFDKQPGSMTDIAIDKDGALFGVTFDDLFACDKATAKCAWLANLPGSFNGLTFVPKGTVSANDETLIGIGTDGSWNAITVAGNTASIKKLGAYGNNLASSGDAFSIEGVGTFATTKSQGQFGGSDKLAQVNPVSGASTVVGDTGVSDLWGFAWQGGKFYGFSSSGSVYEIDVATGKAKFAAFAVPGGLSWWGAGVSTRANGPQ